MPFDPPNVNERDRDIVAATLQVVLHVMRGDADAKVLILSVASGKKDWFAQSITLELPLLDAIVTGALAMVTDDSRKTIMSATLEALEIAERNKVEHCPTKEQLLAWWKARGLALIPGLRPHDLN